VTVYQSDWAETGQDGMLLDFSIDASALDGAEVLLASYTYEDYEGSAFVLFRRGGVLYEVHGSHCSCYGLEGQWDPEATDEATLRAQLERGSHSEWREEILSALGVAA
jgi:hypothetical protein